MQVVVVGAGYVGLVTGVCLAEVGHQVRLIDVDRAKVSTLRLAKLPIYEPHLQPKLRDNLQKKRLEVYSSIEEGIQDAEVVFLALPTPPQEDGSSDLQYVLEAVLSIAPYLSRYTVIITKSTVPVGTTEKIRSLLEERTEVPFDVVSNPEFLREGKAVEDFLYPKRIVLGSKSERANTLVKKLYEPFVKKGCPLLFMDESSAELAKYAANAFLATKISFINEIASLCDKLGADVRQIEQVLELDPRIGKGYLKAGLGYGGSCLPKDISSLRHTASVASCDASLLRAVDEINNRQRLLLWRKAVAHFGEKISKCVFAIWGLTFKPETDDLREAPSLANILAMQEAGCSLRVYDPVAMKNAKKLLRDDTYYASDMYDALLGVDALFVITEWSVFREVDLGRMRQAMRQLVLFDGRNIYEAQALREEGFQYYSIGCL